MKKRSSEIARRKNNLVLPLVGITTLLVGFTAAVIVRFPLKTIDWNGGVKPSSVEFMNAVAYNQHGGTEELIFGKYPKPTITGHNKNDQRILVRVHASSVNPVDFKFRRIHQNIPDWIIPKPKIPGADLAGVVVESALPQFRIGDRVAAMMPLIGSRWGSHSEYVSIDPSLVAKIDDSVDYASAASLPLVSLTVIQSLEKLRAPTRGKKILIHAGAGGVGTFGIQYAKHVLGMYVATTASKEKAPFLKNLGADLVIDYRTQDFTKIVKDYDAVLDTMSFLYEARTLQRNSHVLKKNGHYLNIMSSDWTTLSNGMENALGLGSVWNLARHKLVNIMLPGMVLPRYDFCMVEPNGKQLQLALDLLANGKIQSVIDQTFPLPKVADAHARLEEGHVTGKIAIAHIHDDDS